MLVLTALFSAECLHAAGVNKARLRKYGYTGTYSGIIRGTHSTRVVSTTPFAVSPISDLIKVKVPPPRKGVVKDPKGAGAYSILYTATADKRRARIRGSYYGKAYNPDAGVVTVRSGIREMIITRNTKNGRIIKMTYRDKLTERDENNISVVYAKWSLSGTLR